MEVLLSVSYIVDVEKYDLWDKENGKVKEEIRAELEEKFPQEIVMNGNIHGQRKRLSYVPLEIAGQKCPQCGRWMTDRTEVYSSLAMAKKVNGKAYCECCAHDVMVDDM